MDEKTDTQTIVTEPEVTTTTATAPDTKAGKTFTQAEVDAIVKDRLEREAKKRADAEAKLKAEAEAEALKKNQEWQTLAEKKAAEAEALAKRLAELEAGAKRRAVADKYKLPAELADRLRGETDEELEKDAQALAKLIPPTRSTTSATNPGDAHTGETEAQKYARIFGTNMHPLDPGVISSKGGGVFFTDKE